MCRPYYVQKVGASKKRPRLFLLDWLKTHRPSGAAR